MGNASEGSSATLPLPLGPPPPPPRYTPGPVATIASFGSISHFSDAQSSSPLGQSHQNLFGSTDGKPYVNLLHHDPKMASDFATPIQPQCKRQRHSTVTAVLIVAYLSYHLPLLVSQCCSHFSLSFLRFERLSIPVSTPLQRPASCYLHLLISRLNHYPHHQILQLIRIEHVMLF